MMLGILTEIMSKATPVASVRDRLQMLQRDSDEENESRTTEEASTLFKCRTCNTVYVATEKTECGNCGETVSAIEESTTT